MQRRTTDLEKAIKELRDTQQQVIQQERMRALGTMASGIAHDSEQWFVRPLIS